MHPRTLSRRTLLSGLLAALTLCVACTRGSPMTGTTLSTALARGGYVILMRHASSPATLPDLARTDPDNLKRERQLDETGRASARSMGEAFRHLRIPVEKVLSSPTYRALETARLAQFPAPRAIEELGDDRKSMTADASGTRGAWLRSQVAQAPKPGTNTVIITHYPNISEAFPSDAKDLAEGEALIYQPNGKGSASLVGRVKIGDWASLVSLH